MGKPKKAHKAQGPQAKAKAKAKSTKSPSAHRAATPKAGNRKPAPPKNKARAKALGSGGKPGASLAELRARWPVLTEKEVEAFESLIGDAQADDLGRRTKSQDVLREASRWASAIDTALRSYGDGALKAYSPRRFAYYLSVTTALADAVLAETRRAGEVGKPGGTEETRSAAIDARRETVERLATFAGARAVERTALEEAVGHDIPSVASRGPGQPDASVDSLVRSLRALAYLEIDWLERNDPASQVLAENAGLSHENAVELRSFAEALSTRRLAAALSAPTITKDTPTINRMEGRVLFEMREVRRVFAHAHTRSAVVPELNPASQVAHVFGHKQPKPAASAATNGSAATHAEA
jgi:hypothetical protein